MAGPESERPQDIEVHRGVVRVRLRFLVSDRLALRDLVSFMLLVLVDVDQYSAGRLPRARAPLSSRLLKCCNA